MKKFYLNFVSLKAILRAAALLGLAASAALAYDYAALVEESYNPNSEISPVMLDALLTYERTIANTKAAISNQEMLTTTGVYDLDDILESRDQVAELSYVTTITHGNSTQEITSYVYPKYLDELGQAILTDDYLITVADNTESYASVWFNQDHIYESITTHGYFEPIDEAHSHGGSEKCRISVAVYLWEEGAEEGTLYTGNLKDGNNIFSYGNSSNLKLVELNSVSADNGAAIEYRFYWNGMASYSGYSHLATGAAISQMQYRTTINREIVTADSK